MTPFMHTVQCLLDGDPTPEPLTVPAASTTLARAADAQLVIRALAEQLVSEANAVLREHGETIRLVDDTGPGRLAFTLGYGDRTARVQTEMTGRTAVGQLLRPGRPGEPRRLASEDELQALVLSLITTPKEM